MKVEISIPESLNEITLEQFQRFAAIDPNSNKDFLARKMLEIFCGVTDTLKVKKKDVDRIYSRLNETLATKCNLVPQFELKGVRYGFHPDLENITFGEYIDLDSLLRDKTKNLHKIMAILYRPVTHSSKDLYRIEDYESSTKYAEELKQMPASIAVGALVFFYTLTNDLLKVSLRYLKQKKTNQDATTTQEAKLQESIAGLQQYTNSLKAISQSKDLLKDYQLGAVFLRLASLLSTSEPKN